MANKTDKSNLGYLGEDFQYKLVHAFMEDKEFFKDLYDITDQNMFTNPNLKICVGVMKEYFEKHECPPSYETIDILLRAKAHNPIDLEVFLGELTHLKSISSEDIDLVKELGTKFFRQQNIVKTANQILKIANDGVDENKCEKYVELMSEALSKGVHSNYGSDVTSNIDKVLSPDYRETIATGIDIIDECLEGGIGKGELGVIACPSGVGKTSLTTAFASHAAIELNKKVVQIVFEDTDVQISRKHHARFVSKYGYEHRPVEAKDLSKEENRDYVKNNTVLTENDELKTKYARLSNNLKFFRLPSGEITADLIKRNLKKLISVGFKPDLVIIDYFECLNHDCFVNVSNDYDKEGKTMRKLEAMAGELNIALWIPSQGTKDSINLELVTMDKMGGSVKKAQIAHIILSIAKTTDDAANNRATLAVLKNRAGQSGKVFEQVEFNNGTCVVQGSKDTCNSSSLVAFGREQENKLNAKIMKMALNK